jgi:hypothetical protein
MKLRKKDFKAWLENKSIGAYVGRACCWGGCPIANYLNETDPPDNPLQTRRAQWFVTLDMYFSIPETQRQTTRKPPGWAVRFIKNVDKAGDTDIAAWRALEILDNV